MSDTINLPKNWNTATIGEITDIKVGKDLIEERFKPFKDNEFKYPVYSNAIYNKGLYGYYNFAEYPAESITVTGRGDVGFSFLRNDCFGAIGRLIVLIANERVIPSYLSFYINFGIKFHVESTSVPQLTRAQIANYKVLLPPIPEQQKIAEILSTVDEKIEVIEAQINQTTELKKGLMQQLLTKGIGHTKFKDSPLGKIPESWEAVIGDYISEKITKGSSPNWQGFNYQHEGVLFITSENVRAGNIDLSSPKYLPDSFNQKQKNSILRANDILINIVGASIGRSCLFTGYSGSANINQAVCLLRPKEQFNPNFLVYYLQQDSIIQKLLNTQAGSARQNLSLSDIKNFSFIIPSRFEQDRISNILISIDEKLSTLVSKRKWFISFKKGLMQQLLTGKLRVNLNPTNHAAKSGKLQAAK